MRIGSCFSGVGAMDLGVKAFFGPDTTTEWFIEREAHPRKVLARHFPGVPVHKDITTVDHSQLTPIAMLVGGPPCTDLSVIGRGAGLHGDKSRLFFNMVSIAKSLKPRYVMIENSPMLLNKWRGTVEGALADAGYGVTWARLSAAHVGAPHLRWRCFLLAELGTQHKGVCFPPALPSLTLWPSPVAGSFQDGESVALFDARQARNVKKLGRKFSTSLPIAVKRGVENDGECLRHGVAWVETLQGLPVNWTALEGELDPRPWPAHRVDGMWGDSPQHAHEPPRLCDPKATPNRLARLKALGNLNPPQVYTRALEMLLEGPRQGRLL